MKKAIEISLRVTYEPSSDSDNGVDANSADTFTPEAFDKWVEGQTLHLMDNLEGAVGNGILTAPVYDLEVDSYQIKRTDNQAEEAPERIRFERDALAGAIRDAAVRTGLVREDAPLTGTHLLMCCDDMAQELNR